MMALGFIRARAWEICEALRPCLPCHVKHLRVEEELRARLCWDVMMYIEPIRFFRKGPSASVAILLALIRLYTEVRLIPRVVTSGTLMLTGEIGPVGEIVPKVGI